MRGADQVPTRKDVSAAMPTASLTKRGVAALPAVSKRTIFYDRDIAGFGLRISPASKRVQVSSSSWLVEYRVGGGRSARKRRIVIGDLTKLDPDQARREAKALLARVQLGADPAAERERTRRAECVGDLVESYIRDHVAVKRKATSAKNLRSLANRHLPRSVATRRVDELHRADVSRMHARIGEKQPEVANRALLCAPVQNYIT